MAVSFVPYLHLNDYLTSIQEAQLVDQILDELSNGTRQRKFAESWACEAVKSSLGREYDLSYEFTPTLPYDPLKDYRAYERVIIDYPEWESESNYPVNSCVVFQERGYLCLHSNSDASFTPINWIDLGQQYDIWHIEPPHPIFTLTPENVRGSEFIGNYQTGDIVWWNNRIYSAIIPTTSVGADYALNYVNTSSIPRSNVFPDDRNSGTSYWTDLGEYKINAGVYPQLNPSGGGSNPWVLGDNRNPLIVQIVVDLSLYQLHKRITPENIPEVRIQAKNEAFTWLARAKGEDADLNVPATQPERGGTFAGGSKVKYRNGYG